MRDGEDLMMKPSQGGRTGQDTSKYQKGKEFIDELETELNKKTGKGNNDDNDKAIVNRTPQQEQDLKDKKRKLAELENQQQSGGSGDPKKTN
ncbi:7582_t:CDS:2 [Ambispora leptoticha]|uniref:7582_t:CDS:1 n=1 Tax=Ambispora leptoticha TaxID=144679 RepID=A0A9N9C1N2_9GLOM|nr:7582_t:CDS:2 [Ambispora leptoticha]